MSSKFRTSGFHPIRKLKVILSGLQIAVATEFSVAYKLILSMLVEWYFFSSSTVD